VLIWAMTAIVPAWAEPAVSPITSAAESAYWWGDFAALEKQNATFKQAGQFSASGASNLDMFRSGLVKVLSNSVQPREPYLQELEALTLQWCAEHPKSALAHILHARVLVEHAWSYRGEGFVKDVPPQAWKDFHAYQRRAVDYLNAHAEVALTDSYAHDTLLLLGRGLGWDATQLQAIMQDGLKRNPEDIDLYFSMLTALLPKWGGDAKTLDKYIRQVAEQTRASYGAAMYARLYAAASELEFGHALFENSYVDWATMKQGYEDMHTRFPDSPSRRNRFAYMACLAKDKSTLLALLDELGSRLDASQWGANSERSLEGCQRWARQT
jgi:hypothetical protein